MQIIWSQVIFLNKVCQSWKKIRRSFKEMHVGAVFTGVMINNEPLPLKEYIQHSDRFHPMFHFFLHRQSEEKKGGERIVTFLQQQKEMSLPSLMSTEHMHEIKSLGLHSKETNLQRSDSTDESLSSFNLLLLWDAAVTVP